MSGEKAYGEEVGPESSTVARGTTAEGKRNEERTKDENRERSYVAASHRGDRSIEARMESAQKASEIHEKRTGKALEITQEAVEREENYPEASGKSGGAGGKKGGKSKSGSKNARAGGPSGARSEKVAGQSAAKEGAAFDIAVGEEDLGEEDEGAPFDDQEEDEGDEDVGEEVIKEVAEEAKDLE
ncbi:hypothetical protein DFJ74DRAFT_772882 [Hyaloraphidium curvatum]|nr:hypothetical protein DFJ74DRAFT_772882 [Hyaloraphidium curvatum]